MPIIHVELSAAGLDAAIAELKEYQQKVESLGERVVKRLAEDGAEQARDLVPVYTGDLMSSIGAEVNGDTGYVRAYAEHAAYVEFGTGVVGDGTHPNPVGWAYDVNGHGPDGWVYRAASDGKFYWTMGQPAKPYMYDTAQLLAEAAPYVVREELQS